MDPVSEGIPVQYRTLGNVSVGTAVHEPGTVERVDYSSQKDENVQAGKPPVLWHSPIPQPVDSYPLSHGQSHQRPGFTVGMPPPVVLPAPAVPLAPTVVPSPSANVSMPFDRTSDALIIRASWTKRFLVMERALLLCTAMMVGFVFLMLYFRMPGGALIVGLVCVANVISLVVSNRRFDVYIAVLHIRIASLVQFTASVGGFVILVLQMLMVIVWNADNASTIYSCIMLIVAQLLCLLSAYIGWSLGILRIGLRRVMHEDNPFHVEEYSDDSLQEASEYTISEDESQNEMSDDRENENEPLVAVV
mgnify:FL=1